MGWFLIALIATKTRNFLYDWFGDPADKLVVIVAFLALPLALAYYVPWQPTEAKELELFSARRLRSR